MLRRRYVLGLAAGGLVVPGLAMPGLVRAQSLDRGLNGWPDRPLRLIVAWPPGGSTDVVARIFQPRLQDLLGKPIIIDNRGGASGSIGAGEAARAAPDGYTWLLGYDTQATNESVMHLPFATMEAFAPVSLVATGPLALVTHHSTPFQRFEQVVEESKRNPDSLNYATSGVGGLAHVSTTRLQQLGQFSMTHVPYRGGAPAAQDAVAGHVPLFMTNVVVVSQHLKSGTLRPLGVTTAAETRHVPGAKPFSQMGFPGFEAPTWWAFFGRTGTPQPILDRMHELLVRSLAEPDVRAKIEEQGADVVASSPAECGRFVQNEINRWGEVIRAAGIRADG